ncbi:MAG TPA: HAD-IA family hydrolase [Acidimicrobiales bacterium]|nr:HAD-IA family hydrolase [Acidimicrobiales bacterium]
MHPFELVIFDCDGVLVDSERLAVRLESQIFTNLGWPMTEAEAVERFVGHPDTMIQAELERHLGRPVDWENEFIPLYKDLFERELVLVKGVAEMLADISLPTCVASNSVRTSLEANLHLTGLFEHFEGRIFCAEEVGRGKPAPDVFLHAARTMGVDSSRCVVVEDSAAGITAARAAGMAVRAFAGGLIHRSLLEGDGVVIFDDMSQLAGLISER